MRGQYLCQSQREGCQITVFEIVLRGLGFIGKQFLIIAGFAHSELLIDLKMYFEFTAVFFLVF